MLKTLFLILSIFAIATKCDMLVGGRSSVDLSDPNSETYKNIAEQAQFATSEYTKLYRALNSQNLNTNFEVVRLLSAQQQVVSGMKYYINAEIKDLSSGETKTCEFAIWSQPWLKNNQLVDHQCS